MTKIVRVLMCLNLELDLERYFNMNIVCNSFDILSFC